VGVAAAGAGPISRLEIASALGLVDACIEARREDTRQRGDPRQAGHLGRFLQEIAAVYFRRPGKTDQLEDLRPLFCFFLDGLEVIVGRLPSAD